MQIKQKINLTEKIKTFFKLNWWLVWIANASIVFFVYNYSEKMSAQNQEIKDLLKKEVEGVVFVGANGQVHFTEKTRIDASSSSEFKSAIKNILTSYLIFDASRVTKDYKIEIKSADDVFKNYAPMKEFGENYMALKNKKYPATFGYFSEMLNGVARAVIQDTLPDQIIPIDSIISNYTWDDETNTFSIVVNISVNSFVFNQINNNFDKKSGSIQIRAKGYFDIMSNNTLNPLGIKFFEIGITNASK